MFFYQGIVGADQDHGLGGARRLMGVLVKDVEAKIAHGAAAARNRDRAEPGCRLHQDPATGEHVHLGAWRVPADSLQPDARGDAEAGTDAVRTSWGRATVFVARGRRRRCGRGYSAEDRRGVVGPAVTARTVIDDVVERARACHNGDARRNWCRTAVGRRRMVEPIARSGPWAGRPTGLAAAVTSESPAGPRSPPDSERF